MRAMPRYSCPLLLLTLGGVGLGVQGCGSDESTSGGGGYQSDAGADVSAEGAIGDAGADSLLQMDQSQGEVSEGCPGGCPEDQICSHGTCVTQTTCKDDNDCWNDSYCVAGTGCVPWGTPPDKLNDPACVYVIPPGNFSPRTRCEFSQAPAGDPFPNHVDVQATPTVVNFHANPLAGPPSIVVPFTDASVQPYTETQGVIRVLRGTDCTQEAVLGGVDLDGDSAIDWIRSPSTLAIGDLDLDGVPEVVAYGADNTTLAFTLKGGVWSLLWKARSAPGGAVFVSAIGGGWAGPSIHDLDDDGKPEVIREGYVISSEGVLLSGLPPGYATYSSGLHATVANIDADPAVELMNGAFIWEWTAGAWVAEPAYAGAAPGHVAVADFGPYGASKADSPELAIVASNTLTIRDTNGTVVFGPVALPPGGASSAGGPPTVADYDGDGFAEVGVAGSDFYTVFDIDCSATPRNGGKCEAVNRCDDELGQPGACPAGILWSRKTQDHSSNITGSSVFDFEADGAAEVVYADECFARVYSGRDGEVIFSQYHSSCTWYENPVVADVDGNFRADLVVPSNQACAAQVACVYDPLNPKNSSLDANNVDKEFAGLRCKEPSDCLSNQCDQGYCRCTAGAQCCALADDAQCQEFGFVCAPPPAGTPGTGNTCRAAFPHKVSGIRVYSDAQDKWVRSRTIWSQHAYAVTHIEENGTIPKSSLWQKNWEQPGLNNFRQNVPGTPNGQSTSDPTVGASDFSPCTGGAAPLSVPVCNRGADAVGVGLTVSFFDGATLICETKTTKPLQPGECESVTCIWDSPPMGQGNAKDVTVEVNTGGAVTECKDGNNKAVIKGVYCKQVS